MKPVDLFNNGMSAGEKKQLMENEYNFDEIINREGSHSVKYDLRKQLFGKEAVQAMWVADMDFATPSFIREAILERAKHPVYGYTLRPESCYSSVRKWMKKRFDWEIRNEWLSFSPGIVPAINMCILAYSNPGDGILIQPPVYYPFARSIKTHDRVLLENQLIEKDNKYSVNFGDFEIKASQAGIFILCHPHNPVGRVWERDELERMLKICKKYNVLIISDEIHADLVLFGKQHVPLESLNNETGCKIVTCTAPSKTFNLAGLSTSMLIIPKTEVKSEYDKMMEKLNLGMGNIFGNVAMEAAYTYGEEWLLQLIAYLDGNLKYMEQFILEKIPELTLSPTEATYLAWIDFRKLGLNSEELSKFLCNEAGLGMSDGKTFGPGGEGFQRLNFAVPRELLEIALLKLESAINSVRK